MIATSRILACSLVAALACGCGPGGPQVEMVEGVVVLDGVPIEGATVFFSPVSSHGDAARGLPAAGRTDSDGSFTLNAGGGARPGAGTKAGDYVVTIVKQEADGMPASYNPGQQPDLSKIKIRDLLPTIYKLGETSPLRATVKRGKNTFRFELDSTATETPSN